MGWRTIGDNGRFRLSGFGIFIVAALSVLCLSAIVFGIGYTVLSGRLSGDVPIVASPPSDEASALPAQDPSLEILDKAPESTTEDTEESVSGVTEKQPIYQQEPVSEDVINILIIGKNIGSAKTAGATSNTMMIFSCDLKQNKASIISFMQDIWVPIEGYGYNRLGATYTLGGVGLTINTLNGLFGLDIQDYVIVDFENMIELIDELGGVDINIAAREADYYNLAFGWAIKSGVNKLNGERTLVHARNQKSGGGDFERTRRQRDIMLAVYKKITATHDSKSILNFTDFAINNMETNTQPGKIILLASQVLNGIGLGISQGRVPIDDSWKYAAKDGKSVLAIDFEKNKAYLQSQLYSN